MRIVLDSNVSIAAYLRPGGESHVLLERAARDFEPYTSRAILEEVARVLRVKFGVPRGIASAYIRFLAKHATVVAPPRRKPHVPSAFRDGDEHLVACCFAANADVLVTLDKRLIRVKRIGATGIVHPFAIAWLSPAAPKEAA